jgi:hypothetical protein
MSRRALAAGLLAAAAVGATLTVGVGAAEASTETVYGQYYHLDECNQIGAQLVQEGEYASYSCSWQPFNPGFPGSGILGIATLYVWN